MGISVHLVFVLLVTGAASKNVSYEDVMATGKFCPERDSCSSKWLGGGDRRTLSWQTRNCFCDKDCSLYGDCCIDAESFEE